MAPALPIGRLIDMKKSYYAIAATVIAGMLAPQLCLAGYSDRAKPLSVRDVKDQDRPKPPPVGTGKIVSVTGKYSGQLKGEIKMNGKKILVTQKTVIRGTDETDRYSYDSYVPGSTIWVKGVPAGGRVIATMIFIAGRQSHETGKAGEVSPSVGQ